MSEAVADSNAAKQAEGGGVKEPTAGTRSDQSSVDSSSDSDGSSGSSSSSGSSGSQSTTDTARTNTEDGDVPIQSDNAHSDTDQDRMSNDDSFKSLNATAKVDENIDSPELNVTPVGTQQAAPVSVPTAAGASGQSAVRVKIAVDPLVERGQEALSPVPVTPAKQLEWKDLVATLEAPQNVVPAAAEVLGTPRTAVMPSMSPGELFSPAAPLPVASRSFKAPTATVVVQAAKIRPNSKQVDSPSAHHDKSDSKKSKRRKHRKERSVRKVEESMRQLKMEMREIRKLKERAKSESKKRRLSGDKGQKRAKKSKPKSSDEVESSDSSTPNQPSTSKRISKIPNGRKYQRIAMSRAKQLGVIVENDQRAAGVVAAAKIISTAEFAILPTHAYQDFHQVPGTGLRHIVKLVRDLQDRYAPFIKAIAQLHLGLALDYRRSRNALVVPTEGSPFVPIWCAENDLARATDKPDVDVGELESVLGEAGGALASAATQSTATQLAASSSNAAFSTPKSNVLVVNPVPQAAVAVQEVRPVVKTAKKKKKESKAKHEVSIRFFRKLF